jgi:hypothetical protein
MNPVQGFAFRSGLGKLISAPEWVATWSRQFNAVTYPEEVYFELLDKRAALTDDEINVLGAWKDGACRVAVTGGLPFGKVRVEFNGKWSRTAASCAYDAWRQLPHCRAALHKYLHDKDYGRFLSHVSSLSYTKAGRSGLVTASFGLSRASYVLHVFTGGEFPIYDKNVQRGLHWLSEGRMRKTKTSDPSWYLAGFCDVVRALEAACGARDLAEQRAIDKALFCYGKFLEEPGA